MDYGGVVGDKVSRGGRSLLSFGNVDGLPDGNPIGLHGTAVGLVQVTVRIEGLSLAGNGHESSSSFSMHVVVRVRAFLVYLTLGLCVSAGASLMLLWSFYRCDRDSTQRIVRNLADLVLNRKECDCLSGIYWTKSLKMIRHGRRRFGELSVKDAKERNKLTA